MGLLDIFKKKTLDETLASWVESGKVGKIAEYAENAADKAIRIKSMDYLSQVKRSETAVNTLMRLICDDDKEIKLAACKALKEIGTRREVDRLYQIEGNETDAEVKEAIVAAAVASKERTPMFLD